ncbi:DUF3164 family protein [Pedobacter sp. WC2423]|uniref:DUF3164 family protein n=1 Tax=Pedobacter sp. WC2423 TaxID=3234142 RepID=UPI003466D4CF
MKALEELSTAELKAILENREKAEKGALIKKEQAYIKNRDAQLEELSAEALELGLQLARFKSKVHAVMNKQAEALAAYGKVRGNSKGGFSITNAASNLRIVRRRDTEPTWDERASKAVDLIKDFLGDTIKKRDVKLYEILIKFLEKNHNGDLEYSAVFGLMEHEDKFDDPRWLEGLRLLKQSYTVTLKCFGYEFKQKNDAGKWITQVLNFSSL